MKNMLPILVLLFAAHDAVAACAAKRLRDPAFVELAVADDAIRPSGVADFGFITDDTTVDALIAKVGPPDGATGTRITKLIWCFPDGAEVWVETPDRVVIEAVRHNGKQIFRRARKK